MTAPEDSVIELLTSAQLMSLSRLRKMVENLVGYSLDTENVSCILEVACLHEFFSLQRACLMFIVKEYSAVKKTMSFKQMNQQASDFLFENAPLWGLSLTSK